jgi:L-alanine-DL-glutamate epimerase-like enolase superfamily enzyme
MKITDLSVMLFSWDNIPPVSYSDKSPAVSGASELGLVTLYTDEGIEGNAFLGSSFRGARLDVASLILHLKPLVIGQDPLDRERLFLALQGRIRATTYRCVGAVDIALWDIAGKAAGLPIHRLIGAYRHKAPAYASSPVYRSVREYAEEVLAVQAAGYKAYKIHPPSDQEACIAVCRAVREAVGDDYRVMLDACWQFDFPAALKLGRAIEELNFYWYEDPLADDDLYNYVKLKQKLDIPIMATEYSPGGFHAYAPWLTAQATDYLRGDVAVKGGISAILKTAHLAEGFHMNYEIHHGGNSLNNVANLHVLMAIKNCEYFEVLLPSAAQKYGLVQDIEIDREGFVHAIERPGLGAEIDFDLITRKTVEVL